MIRMISKRDIRFFNVARAVSKCSDFRQHHIGAVITYKGDVLSVAFNTNKTSTNQFRFNRYRNFDDNKCVIPKTHAEIGAINKLPYYIYENDFDMNKAAIYIWREHKNGSTALAAPCPACRAALIEHGIRNIYYTTEDGCSYERIS